MLPCPPPSIPPSLLPSQVWDLISDWWTEARSHQDTFLDPTCRAFPQLRLARLAFFAYRMLYTIQYLGEQYIQCWTSQSSQCYLMQPRTSCISV